MLTRVQNTRLANIAKQEPLKCNFQLLFSDLWNATAVI